MGVNTDVDFDGGGALGSVDPDDDNGDGVSDGVDECPTHRRDRIQSDFDRDGYDDSTEGPWMMTAVGWKTPRQFLTDSQPLGTLQLPNTV